jgi:uncharacterized membrane protein YphA (DoxX/SURF4 family)
MGIYVEIRIRAPLDELWRYTQDPAIHERWDLRFTNISYLPRLTETEPQRFLYATRIGLGARITGEGSTTAERTGADGTRTSALRFWSNDKKSLIREGSGYWQYIPTDDGIRFLTWYDYETRFGKLGRAFDALIFRPLMGWATAWSFDRLRLWIEQGLDPQYMRERSVIHAISRITLAMVFLYHGLVPKLLAQHPDEVTMLANSGVPTHWIGTLLISLGIAEIAWGLLLLATWRSRWPLAVTASAMPVALMAVAATSPAYLLGAFTPVTLNLLVTSIALIGWLVGSNLPSARRCLRRRPTEAP